FVSTSRSDPLTASVSVISDSTNTVVATVNVGRNPYGYHYGLAYDSGKGEVFVATSASNTVSVISDSTNAVVAIVNVVGEAPGGMAYDSGKGEVFVANTASGTLIGTVSVISDSTNTVVATVNVGTYPNSVAYDSGKGEVFVANPFTYAVYVISDGAPSTITSSTASSTSTTSTTISSSTSSVQYITTTNALEGGGGIPSVSYQLLGATIITLLLIASYLMV